MKTLSLPEAYSYTPMEDPHSEVKILMALIAWFKSGGQNFSTSFIRQLANAQGMNQYEVSKFVELMSALHESTFDYSEIRNAMVSMLNDVGIIDSENTLQVAMKSDLQDLCKSSEVADVATITKLKTAGVLKPDGSVNIAEKGDLSDLVTKAYLKSAEVVDDNNVCLLATKASVADVVTTAKLKAAGIIDSDGVSLNASKTDVADKVSKLDLRNAGILDEDNLNLLATKANVQDNVTKSDLRSSGIFDSQNRNLLSTASAVGNIPTRAQMIASGAFNDEFKTLQLLKADFDARDIATGVSVTELSEAVTLKSRSIQDVVDVIKQGMITLSGDVSNYHNTVRSITSSLNTLISTANTAYADAMQAAAEASSIESHVQADVSSIRLLLDGLSNINERLSFLSDVASATSALLDSFEHTRTNMQALLDSTDGKILEVNNAYTSIYNAIHDLNTDMQGKTASLQDVTTGLVATLNVMTSQLQNYTTAVRSLNQNVSDQEKYRKIEAATQISDSISNFLSNLTDMKANMVAEDANEIQERALSKRSLL